MFYLGGMTLGYFTPPAKKEKPVRPDKTPVFQNYTETTDDEKARDQQLARAFLTPWHLFY